LKNFGGVLDIDDYRKNLLTNKMEYNVIFPPVMVMIPQIEEIHAHQKSMNKKSRKIRENKKFIPLNMLDVDKAVNNLKKKHVNVRAKNCLEKTMGIRQI
jgi:hypothetical protein